MIFADWLLREGEERKMFENIEIARNKKIRNGNTNMMTMVYGLYDTTIMFIIIIIIK